MESLVSWAMYIASIFWLRYETVKFNENILRPSVMDFVLCFIPLLNTGMAFVYLVIRMDEAIETKNKSRGKNLITKFFGFKD